MSNKEIIDKVGYGDFEFCKIDDHGGICSGAQAVMRNMQIPAWSHKCIMPLCAGLQAVHCRAKVLHHGPGDMHYLALKNLEGPWQLLHDAANPCIAFATWSSAGRWAGGSGWLHGCACVRMCMHVCVGRTAGATYGHSFLCIIFWITPSNGHRHQHMQRCLLLPTNLISACARMPVCVCARARARVCFCMCAHIGGWGHI